MKTADIYISYPASQIDIAYGLASRLESLGISCWIAARDLPLGRAYSDGVETAIASCRAYVIMVNRQSFCSNTTLFELRKIDSRRLRERNIPVILIKTEDIQLTGEFEYYLSDVSIINGFSVPFSTWSNKVYRSLRNLLREKTELRTHYDDKVYLTERELTTHYQVHTDKGIKAENRKNVPYDGSGKFVFVSYARSDEKLVIPIINGLQNRKCRVWYDAEIHPGAEWDDFVASKILDCGYMIAFISNNFINSENCKDELYYARDNNKRRLLVYLDNVELPRGMAFRLNRLQAIKCDAYHNEKELIDLILKADQFDSFCS